MIFKLYSKINLTLKIFKTFNKKHFFSNLRWQMITCLPFHSINVPCTFHAKSISFFMRDLLK